MFKLSQLSAFLQKIKKCKKIMVATVVLLWMVSLVSSNYANSQNLQRNDLSENVKMAEDELRLINAVVSELQTTQRIENESKKLELVKVDSKEIIYLNNTDDKVALK